VSLFSHPDYDRHRSVHFHEDTKTGLKAIVAVHRLWDLPAVGGCRFWTYDSDDDALKDALRLARGMSFKCVMSEVGYAGGKCVILRPREIPDRKALLAAMGDFVESLGGIIKTGMDIGLSVEDVEAMAARCSHIVGRGKASPAEVTARGVLHACMRPGPNSPSPISRKSGSTRPPGDSAPRCSRPRAFTPPRRISSAPVPWAV